jgi:cell volume regulation protein A
MDLNLLFALLGALLVLAFIANRLVKFTGVPDVLILMATGVLIGPVLHWVNPETFRGVTQGFGALALLLILFEGGLDLKLREVASRAGGGAFLALVSFTLSMCAVAAVCRHMLHFRWLYAFLAGSALGCISSSIILPVLQQVAVRRDLKVTLLVEASLGDALGVLAVTTLLDVAGGGNASVGSVGWAFGSSLLLAVACGVLAGMLWSHLLPALSEQRFWNVLTFAAVLLVYSGVHALGGNDLVSVLVFGLTLTNFSTLRERLHLTGTKRASDWFGEPPVKGAGASAAVIPQRRHDEMMTFHGELAFLIRTFFFVLLGSLVDFSALRRTAWLALACFGALLLARWVAVQSGRWAWRGFSSHERELMVLFLPRGLITAVLGIEVLARRGAEFKFLPELAFAVIVLTNVLLLVGTFRARNLSAQSAAESAPAAAS